MRLDLSSAERDQLKRIEALRDEDIDVTDIPEAPADNWKHARRGARSVYQDSASTTFGQHKKRGVR